MTSSVHHLNLPLISRTITQLIKTPELLESTLQGHIDVTNSATASREDKFNAYQFIYDLFQADFPPMEAVDKLKLLHHLSEQAKATTADNVSAAETLPFHFHLRKLS